MSLGWRSGSIHDESHMGAIMRREGEDDSIVRVGGTNELVDVRYKVADEQTTEEHDEELRREE